MPAFTFWFEYVGLGFTAFFNGLNGNPFQIPVSLLLVQCAVSHLYKNDVLDI